MQTCEEISKLVSEGLDRELSRLERFAVWFHLLYCVACRRYRRQVRLLRLVLRSYLRQLEAGIAGGAVRLSDDARERISQRLARGQ